MIKLTKAGEAVLLRCITGLEKVVFKAVRLGNGTDAGEDPSGLTSPLFDANVDGITIEDPFATLNISFNNSIVSEGFRATELGIIIEDPADSTKEVMYAYQYTEPEKADYIPAMSERTLETRQDIMIYVGDAQNVSAAISGSLVYATQEDIKEIREQLGKLRLDADAVDLGNVPNVTTNDQTPTYTMAGSLAELSSGEKLSDAFGKISKAVSELIAHIRNKSNPHGVTPEQINAANKSHKHNAADISEGILATARGGTGNAVGRAPSAEKLSTARDIQVNLASGTAASFDGSANAAPGVTGVLPVANGGSGRTDGKAVALATARTITVKLDSQTGGAFDGSKNVDAGVSGVLPVANGGTGKNDLGGTDYATQRYRGIGLYDRNNTPSSVPNGQIIVTYQ